MRRPLFMACLCLVIVLTIGRILTGADTGDAGVLPPDGSPVRITGRIDTRTSETIILKSISIIQNDLKYSYSGKLQCELTNTQEVQSLRLGQHIVLEGFFSHFDAATNHGEFDVRAYSAGKGIGGRVRKAQVLAAEEDYSFLREKLFAFRRRLHDRLAKVFPEKEASVMQTLLLGEKEELDEEVKALYQRNGIAHILSISGLHITLLGMGCYRLLKRLGAPVRVAAAGGAMTLLLYGMMVGMSVSASRAIGMYLLQMLGIFVGRTYDMLTGVGLLAALLVLQQPERLGDVSFLMSFGAVLGICLLTPVFAGDGREDNAGVETASGVVAWLLTVTDILGDSAYERNKYREGWRKVVYERLWRMVSALKRGFAASAGVILFTLPIQLWFFYEIPVYSVLLNLLVLPFMSVVMAGGILSLIPGLGIAGTVDCLILWWYEWICERFGELPGAVWCVGRPAKWQMAVYYSGLFVLIIGRNYAEKWKRQRLYAAYVAENNHGDGHHAERERQRRETRGVDDSVRGRKRESNRKKMQHFDRYSEICPTRWRHVLVNFWYTWQGVMKYRNGVMYRIVAAMILVLIVGLLTGNFDRGSRVTFLDVGQGDGIVVETGQGAYLFDCGSTSRRKIGEYVLKPYLKSRGIQSLRGVFVSHPDEDHMNGILELLENGGEWGITVEQMFLPAITEAERREAFEKLLVAAEYAGVPVSYIKCGDEIRDSRLRLRCLHPEENTTLADANAYSECFYVEVFAKAVKWGAAEGMEASGEGGRAASEVYGENGSFAVGVTGERTGHGDTGERKNFGVGAGKLSILLTGDVEGEGEQQLTQELQTLKTLQEAKTLRVAQESQALQNAQKLQESQEPREQQELWESRRQGGFKVDILKVAHHGSGYSTSSEFLAAAGPAAAIISCGRNNSYGHPHAATLQRLEDAKVPWYLTTDYGALTVTVDSHGNRLQGYLRRK
ncbi:MAG: ComEC/Rec2 family competence protein [Waltera sp.]|uniref:ComEC/Rec2 family competence protein n=1 Tax=Waltera sp. TaxID=2815806 RepID=UPI00399ABFFA